MCPPARSVSAMEGWRTGGCSGCVSTELQGLGLHLSLDTSVSSESEHQLMVCACHAVICSAAAPGTGCLMVRGSGVSLQAKHSQGALRLVARSCSSTT